jgi:hypothetical protein
MLQIYAFAAKKQIFRRIICGERRLVAFNTKVSVLSHALQCLGKMMQEILQFN